MKGGPKSSLRPFLHRALQLSACESFIILTILTCIENTALHFKLYSHRSHLSLHHSKLNTTHVTDIPLCPFWCLQFIKKGEGVYRLADIF